jgi:hypothetical protein
MNSVRTSRLANQLLSRQAVHYDVATKERLTFRQRSLALRKYKGKGNVFGSFTQLPEPSYEDDPYKSRQKIGPKLGINPQTKYNTPIGVYAYPVDYILSNVSEDAFSVPFAAQMNYLHIFSVSGLERTLTFDEDDSFLVDEFKEEAPEDFESEEYNEVKDLVLRINNYVNSTIDEIPEKYWSPGSRFQWEKWFDKLKRTTGFEYDPDNEVSYTIMTVGGLELYQLSRILTLRKFPLERVLAEIKDPMVHLERAKTIMFPYEDQIIKLPEVQAMGLDAYTKFKSNVVLAEGQRVECDQAFAWNCTRHLSGFNPMKWTGLMRRMGLIGAVDHGTSTIHENEPIQAVFFDPSSIKVLEVIHNQAPGRSNVSGSDAFSEWAADVEKHMPNAVGSFSLAIRRFLTTPSRQNQASVFARLSWLQQHGRKFSESWNYAIIKNLIYEIDNKRESSLADPKVLDKIVQALQRFLR